MVFNLSSIYFRVKVASYAIIGFCRLYPPTSSPSMPSAVQTLNGPFMGGAVSSWGPLWPFSGAWAGAADKPFLPDSSFWVFFELWAGVRWQALCHHHSSTCFGAGSRYPPLPGAESYLNTLHCLASHFKPLKWLAFKYNTQDSLQARTHKTHRQVIHSVAGKGWVWACTHSHTIPAVPPPSCETNQTVYQNQLKSFIYIKFSKNIKRLSFLKKICSYLQQYCTIKWQLPCQNSSVQTKVSQGNCNMNATYAGS